MIFHILEKNYKLKTLQNYCGETFVVNISCNIFLASNYTLNFTAFWLNAHESKIFQLTFDLKKKDFLKMSLIVKDESFHVNDTNINQILTSKPIRVMRSFGIKLITKRYLWGKYKTYAKLTFNSFRAGQGIKSKWCVIIN